MIRNFFKFILKFLHGFIHSIIKHVEVMYGQFDPVINGPVWIYSCRQLNALSEFRKKRVKSNLAKHDFFCFVWCLFVFNIFDNIYIMWMDDFDYYNRRMPEHFYHKIFPERFWPQSDLIMTSIMLCSLFVYYNLWQGEWLDDRYNMYFIRNKTGKQTLIVNDQGII